MLWLRTPRFIVPVRRYRYAALLIAGLIGAPLVVGLIAVGLIAALALSGTSIDASRWRDAVMQRASAELGRPVVLQGAFELEPRLSRELGIHLGALRILNPPGFTGQELLAIGELHVQVDVFEALRGRLRSSSIEARDVGLWLERDSGGRGNWTSTLPRDPGEPPAEIDVASIVVRGLGLHYRDARSPPKCSLRLDELSGSLRRDHPLRLVAHGRSEWLLPFSLSVEGGALRRLQDDAERWPFAADAIAPGARLHAHGWLDAGRRTARVEIDADAEDLASAEQLLDTKLTQFGTASVQATVNVAAGAVEVSRLHARLGESRFSGHIALASGGARPRLTGAFEVEALDLRPFMTARAPVHGPRSASEAAVLPDLPLRTLAAYDAELDVRVEQVLGLGIDVRAASAAWRADRQGVRVPMSATIAGARFDGGLDLDTSAPVPTLACVAGAKDVVVGDLARGLGFVDKVAGTVGRIDLRLAGSGEAPDALARSLGLSLRMAAARLSAGDGAGPGQLVLDAFELGARPGERLRGHARGALGGERAELRFRGGALADVLFERTLPLELDLTAARSTLQVEGVVAFAGAARDTALRFRLQSSNVGDLMRPLGVASQASFPLSARGQLRLRQGDWALDRTALELGRSQLTVEAHSARVGSRSRIAAKVDSPLLDVQELSTMRAATDRRGRAGADALAAPVIELLDADVDFNLRRVRFAHLDLDDIAFVARTREGRLLPASVTGAVAGAPFTANVALDLQAPQPAASLDLSADTIDIGTLLRGLGIAEDIDGHARALKLHVQARGSSPGEWVAHSTVDARVSGGSLTVLGPAQSAIARIGVHAMRVAAMPGERVQARIDGEIDEIPVEIEVSSGTLAELARDAARVPFALTARGAGAQLTLDGDVTLPLGSGGQLSFAMRGEQLDTLSALARVELPAWGPWSFGGPIRMTPTGYELQGLHLDVGRSRLSGTGTLDVSGARPALNLQVTSPSLQLDDFPLPERLTDSPPPGDGRGLRGAATRMAGRTDTLLSAAFLRRLDATVDVKAKEVLSGDDRLADGALRVKLERGHLDLDPVVVNLPGGAVRLSISYDLKENEVELEAAAYVEAFDYGIIARRLGRADDVRGLFSLNLELKGQAPSLDAIMRNASGRVDFAVWPTELRSGVFNLWSVNLVLKLLPLIDPDARPRVNCIIGRFDLEHGDLRDDKILIDTSAVRIRGAGHADLRTEELAFVFRPRSKGFALFRLQTPLRVTGTLDDQRFGVAQGDLAVSVLRLIASPILVPIEWLTLGPLPQDGADVCTDPLRTSAR